MPRKLIKDVIVNPNLLEGAGDNLKPWLDVDSIVENAGLFAFANGGIIYRPQAPTALRAYMNNVPDGAPLVDEFGNCYSIITSKGIGLSIYALNRRSQNANAEQVRSKLVAYRDPHGFFGLGHGRQDMEITNDLAGGGARVSRALAILALDHAKFRSWAASVLGDSSYPCLEMLDMVETNGDTAAILVRMFPAERIGDVYEDRNDGRDKLDGKGYFSPQNSKRRAAATLLSEVFARGESVFAQRYGLSEYDGFIVRPLLKELQLDAAGQGDFKSLLFFQAYFNEWNKAIKEVVSVKRYGGTLTVQMNSQNTDLLGTWGDFETGIQGDPQYKEDSIQYLKFPVGFESLEYTIRKIATKKSSRLVTNT